MARFNLVHKYHDEVGHPGVERCLKVFKETYWFPKMRRFVSKYVHACMNSAFGKGEHGRREGFCTH